MLPLYFLAIIIDLPFNATVQMVLANYGDEETADGKHHTIHLHGHGFVVMKTGFPIADPKTGQLIEKNKDLYCADKLCRDMHCTEVGRAPLIIFNFAFY